MWLSLKKGDLWYKFSLQKISVGSPDNDKSYEGMQADIFCRTGQHSVKEDLVQVHAMLLFITVKSHHLSHIE